MEQGKRWPTQDNWDQPFDRVVHVLKDVSRDQGILVEKMMKFAKEANDNDVIKFDTDTLEGIRNCKDLEFIMSMLYRLVTLQLKTIEDLHNLEQVLDRNNSIFNLCPN